MDSPDVPASPTATVDEFKEVDSKKREVTPQQQEASKKRLKVADDVKAEEWYDDYKVCQFVVQNLKARGGSAITDYSVSMLVGKHGLFDLVLKIFEVLNQGGLSEDEYFDHLWFIVFNGTKYSYGWRGSGVAEDPTGHIDEQDIRPLHNLGLDQGQKGTFEGQSASFDFVVKEINGVPEKDVKYPKYSAIPPFFSSLVSDDWISGDQITACLQARDEWQDYYSGDENSTKIDYTCRPSKIVPCKPKAPKWDYHEMQLLGLMINAGHKFTKSWKNILQYALVRRTQDATSFQWYRLQKEQAYYLIEYIGLGRSNAEKIILAKKVAKSRVENIPQPPTQAEILAERNKMMKSLQQLRSGCTPSDSDGDNGCY